MLKGVCEGDLMIIIITDPYHMYYLLKKHFVK